MINTKPEIKERRKELRNNMTAEEKIIWKYIKNNQLGVKFRRQHSIDYYIADFYCSELKIVIEIDGSQHYSEDGIEYDMEREEFMKSIGIRTIRFSNYDVLNNIEGVVEKIKEEIKTTSPLSWRTFPHVKFIKKT